MRFTNHTLITAAVLLGTAALSITPAMAATKVDVPFTFVASGKSFPAGTYSIAQGDMSNTLKLQGSATSFTAISVPGDSHPSTNRVVLTFDQVGNKYLLRAIQYGSLTTPRIDRKVREGESAQERPIVGGQ